MAGYGPNKFDDTVFSLGQLPFHINRANLSLPSLFLFFFFAPLLPFSLFPLSTMAEKSNDDIFKLVATFAFATGELYEENKNEIAKLNDGFVGIQEGLLAIQKSLKDLVDSPTQRAETVWATSNLV